MSIPTIGGGQQIGDGNTNEVNLYIQTVPIGAATSTATLTVAQLTSSVLVGNPTTSAASYTLPTVALLEASLGNAKVGSSFVTRFVNIGTSSGVVTMVAGTGWTLVGKAAVAITSGVTLVNVKTGAGTWTLYIV